MELKTLKKKERKKEKEEPNSIAQQRSTTAWKLHIFPAPDGGSLWTSYLIERTEAKCVTVALPSVLVLDIDFINVIRTTCG